MHLFPQMQNYPTCLNADVQVLNNKVLNLVEGKY